MVCSRPIRPCYQPASQGAGFHFVHVHAQHFGWLGWAKNGQSAGTAGYSYRLEAIQIVLVPKGGSAP